MAHILFADANESAMRTLRRAQELGYSTSIVRSASLQMYPNADWIASALERTRRNICLPVTSDAGLMTDAIASIHDEEPVVAVIAQLEASIEATAMACDRLSIPFTCADGVLNARNKARARDLLEAAGLVSARHAVASTVDGALAAAEELGYPVIAKPTSGTDSLLAFRADSAAQLAGAAAAILEAPAQMPDQLREQMSRGVLVEEHLAGELVSAEFSVINGECYPLIVCGRSRGLENECVEMGAALPANLCAADAQRCYDYAAAACRAIGLDTGLFHVELMFGDRGPVLVEVNPRPMGGVMTAMYERLTGRDFSDYIIDTYMGRPPRDVVSARTGTITARKIMPRVDGELRPGIDFDWVKSYDRRLISFHNYAFTPGTQVRRNQVLARYIVLGDGWNDAMNFADAMLPKFEEQIGVPIYHSAPIRPCHQS